jgi:serine protease AprX
MATKKGPPGVSPPATVLAARVANPFILVPHAAADLTNVDVTGGGGTEIVPVTAAVRAELGQTLASTRAHIATSQAAYTTLPSTLVLRMRPKAIAKSHRPIMLVANAGLEPAGHASLDEMLVGSSPTSLEELSNLIASGNTIVLRNNISAILRIEPWTRQRRNPEGSETLRVNGRALLRPFRFRNDDTTTTVRNNLLATLNLIHAKHSILTGFGSEFIIRLDDLDELPDPILDLILEHPGIRSVFAEPVYQVGATGSGGPMGPAGTPMAIGLPQVGIPKVAVFDSGAGAGNPSLNPWIASRDIYVLPPDTDHIHGNAVASLVAGATAMNATFVCPPCLIHDVSALENGGSRLGDLALRLSEAVAKRPDVKVWNVSLGENAPCDTNLFSELAQVLDALTDQHGVLFVVAAGNYKVEPRRVWPPINDALTDRVGSPGESVRALTVGSICHAGSPTTLNQEGEPAAYSRRGPGPVFTPKPDIVHHGGNVDSPWIAGTSSNMVLAPNGVAYPHFGTSYAAPMVSALTAHVWQSLLGHTSLKANPSLVKALMMHAAQLSGPAYAAWERRYYGAGFPKDALSVLFDRDDSFTLVFEASLIPGAWRWRKTNYPVPATLRHNGKFRGEVIITAAYAPPLNASYGSEYVRANLELGFGVDDGENFHGQVPQLREKGSAGYESEQIEHGGKWSPVKVHRKKFPQGVAGDVWALNATLTLRALEPQLQSDLKAYIVVTLRAVDGDPRVHTQGIQAIQAVNWVHHSLPVHVPVTV